MDYLLHLLITGLTLGSIFALMALGWVFVYKCSGILNMALGELTLIGGFVSLALYTNFARVMPEHAAFLFALAGALFVGLVLGLLTERIFLRKMIGEPIIAVIMVTVGLSLFFRGMVFIIWDRDTHFFDPRVFAGEPIRVAGISVGQAYIWSFVAALILIAVVVCFFNYTRRGLSLRAYADDDTAALSSGVSAKFVLGTVWAIAFMTAGAGGTLLGALTGVDDSVRVLGLLVLPVVVIGGLGSIPGAIIGGLIIGILQSLAGGYLDAWFPGEIKVVAPLVFMLVFLLLKPYGLWDAQRIERL